METRAYLAAEDEDLLRLTVRENVPFYATAGYGNLVLSTTLPFDGDATCYVMHAQPEQPFKDADRVLAEYGWKREGSWLVGDVVTGTYARVSRTKHVVQGTDPIKARHIHGNE